MSDRVDQAPNGSNSAQRRATILPLDRFNAFSDGVFAIAITLLVLEIAVPPLSAPLLPALKELWPDFLDYFIIARQPHLLVDDLAKGSFEGLYRQRWVAIGVGALAVVLALVALFVAVALYLVVAVLFLVLPLLGMHRARRNAGRQVQRNVSDVISGFRSGGMLAALPAVGVRLRIGFLLGGCGPGVCCVMGSGMSQRAQGNDAGNTVALDTGVVVSYERNTFTISNMRPPVWK